jgi:DNA polymerase III delta prime subunit
MINTKLILIDGIPGSGKSTTAHFIARQLEKNGIKTKWFHETDMEHPLGVSLKEKVEGGQDPYKFRLFVSYPEKLTEFVSNVINDECVYIIEAYLFQNILNQFFKLDTDKHSIRDFYKKLFKIISSLNPVVIYLYKKNVDKAVKNSFLLRGNSFKEFLVGKCENLLYCKNRNLIGESGIIQMWYDLINLTFDILDKVDFRKIMIENSDNDWDKYRKQILAFLDVNFIDEIVFDPGFEEFCGFYSGIPVYIKNDRLCIEWGWPDIKLLPIKKDSFELEGFPSSIQFQRNQNNEIVSLKISKSSCNDFISGEEKLKLNAVFLEKSELESFCGEYWCETEDISRKIVIKNSDLYYVRNENNESKLIPISKTQFVMIVISDNRLDFNLKDGKYQFVLNIKGQEPLLFVRR